MLHHLAPLCDRVGRYELTAIGSTATVASAGHWYTRVAFWTCSTSIQHHLAPLCDRVGRYELTAIGSTATVASAVTATRADMTSCRYELTAIGSAATVASAVTATDE
eukprot:s158_g24.t1